MRNLSSGYRAALGDLGNVIIRLFMKGDFGSGIWGFWTDAFDVAVEGVTYYGASGVVSVSSFGGVSDGSIPGMSVKLSGLDAEARASFFDEVWHQRAASVSIGLLDKATRNLIGLDTAFAGYMDDAKETGASKKPNTLEIKLEDSAMRGTRTFANVRSDADQRDRDASDGLFKFTATVGQTTVYWNQPTPKTGAKPSGA